MKTLIFMRFFQYTQNIRAIFMRGIHWTRLQGWLKDRLLIEFHSIFAVFLAYFSLFSASFYQILIPSVRLVERWIMSQSELVLSSSFGFFELIY